MNFSPPTSNFSRTCMFITILVKQIVTITRLFNSNVSLGSDYASTAITSGVMRTNTVAACTKRVTWHTTSLNSSNRLHPHASQSSSPTPPNKRSAPASIFVQPQLEYDQHNGTVRSPNTLSPLLAAERNFRRTEHEVEIVLAELLDQAVTMV